MCSSRKVYIDLKFIRLLGSGFISKQGAMVRLYYFPMICVSLAVRNTQNFVTEKVDIRKQPSMEVRRRNVLHIFIHFHAFHVLFT